MVGAVDSGYQAAPKMTLKMASLMKYNLLLFCGIVRS